MPGFKVDGEGTPLLWPDNKGTPEVPAFLLDEILINNV